MTTINSLMPNVVPSGDGDTVNITSIGIAASFDLQPAFSSIGAKNLTILNFGAIDGDPAGGTGLLFTDLSTGIIVNELNANIVGHDVGVEMDSTDGSLKNFGTISCYSSPFGSTAVRFGDNSSGNSLENHGLIAGGWYGILDVSVFGENLVVNSGTVRGVVDGISIATKGGVHTNVNNSGTIHGGSYAIASSGAGGLDLTNIPVR